VIPQRDRLPAGLGWRYRRRWTNFTSENWRAVGRPGGPGVVRKPCTSRPTFGRPGHVLMTGLGAIVHPSPGDGAYDGEGAVRAVPVMSVEGWTGWAVCRGATAPGWLGWTRGMGFPVRVQGAARVDVLAEAN